MIQPNRFLERPPFGGLLCTVLLVVAGALAGAQAAEAAPKRVSGFFPTSLTSGAATGQFSTPRGVAVNSTGAGAADAGDLYVVDSGNSRVQVFSSAGAFKFMLGRDVVKPGGAGNVANNEVQTVTVAGATGGTFRLLMQGAAGITPPIPFNAPAVDPGTPGVVDSLQEALEQSVTIGAGNVSVSGPAGGPWSVEFVGALADSEVQQLTTQATGLTPMPGSTVSVTTVVDGANAAEKCTTAGDCKAGLSGPRGGMLAGGQGIAIDQSDGSVYVTEQTNLRVQKFTADGSFVRAWGKDVSVGDPSVAGEVCTVAADCKAGVSGGTTLARGGEFTSTFSGFPAVAPTGAPNAGNVVVADPANRRVQEFDSAGGFVRAWGYDVVEPGGVTTFEVCTVKAECKTASAGGGVGQFAIGQPKRVAVDSTGAVYTVETDGGSRVQKFDAGLTAPAVFSAATLSGTSTADGPSDVAIGGADRVLVAKQFGAGVGSPSAPAPERRVLELDSAGALLDVHGVGGGLGFGDPTFAGSVEGLAVDTSSGTVYLSALRFMLPATTTAHRVYTLDPVPPASGSLGLAWVNAHSASLVGTVNANGPATPLGAGIRTTYRVEASDDGVDWTTVVPDTDIGNGTDSVAASVVADGLRAGATYQTRIVLAKSFNQTVTVPGPSFTTPASRPDVQALPATDLEQTTATLNARINPNGSATSYRFEYGPTVAYGSSVPVPDADAGSPSDAAVFSQPVTGLQAGTTYHFRVVASNATGTAVTGDRTVTTDDVTPPPARAYEMVSQADKIGGVGVGLWMEGLGQLASSGIASYTGERFLVGGAYGSPLNGDSKHGYTNDWSFAQRSDSAGWLSHSPITHPNYAPQIAQLLIVHAVSEDLSRFFVNGGNNTPVIFPEMGAGWKDFDTGFFIDWGTPPSQPTRWELLGPANLDQIGDVGSENEIWNTALAADGSALVAQTKVDTGSPARSAVFGLAGDGDPTWPTFGDLVAGRSVYLADTAGLPADTFAGTGDRELVNVCRGEGADRTRLPAVQGGVLESVECPQPLPGRDSRLISDRGAALSGPTNDPALEGTVSDDGTRVFFMSPDPIASGVPNGSTQFCSGTGAGTLCPPQLYVRQKDPDGSITTRWISKAEPELFGAQAASLTGAVRFEGSTPDGRRVFFRTNSPLTVDDPNGTATPPPDGVRTGTPSNTSWDLYMYEFPADPNADIGSGQLTRISAGPGGDGDCNSPLPAGISTDAFANLGAAALRYASDDGQRVYFVCSAPLPGVAQPANGTITAPGGTATTADQTNLYLYDAHESPAGRWTFVARIPRTQANGGVTLEACASTGASPRSPLIAESGVAGKNILAQPTNGAGANCVNGTADGAFVTFFTRGRLLADDPASPETGDIYAYDAAADELVRITAVQGGVGGTYLCAPGRTGSPLPTDTAACNGDGGVDQQSAVSTLQGGVANHGLGVATDPEVPGDRAAFFQSGSRLVPQDLDDGYDVYQWHNGKLSLVTSGAVGSKHALYKGNDRDGRNVYFVTQDRLTWQDYDDVADVYTARVDGGIDQPVDPPVCDVLADACQGAGAGAVSTAPVTSPQQSDDNVVSERRVLSVAALGAKARLRAARTGAIGLSIRVAGSGPVRVLARARLGGRSVKVADTSKQATGAGIVKVKVRLNAKARKALRAGRRLAVTLRVSQPGARSRTATVGLKRGKRS